MAKFLPILVVLIIGGASGFGLGYMTRGDGYDGRPRRSVTDRVSVDDESCELARTKPGSSPSS